jgi:hypothetical protein
MYNSFRLPGAVQVTRRRKRRISTSIAPRNQKVAQKGLATGPAYWLRLK